MVCIHCSEHRHLTRLGHVAEVAGQEGEVGEVEGEAAEAGAGEGVPTHLYEAEQQQPPPHRVGSCPC